MMTSKLRQQGFSLVEVAIGIGLIGSAIAAGYGLLQAGENNSGASDRFKLLTAADRAIASFIAQNGRLPCPDTTGSGLENCAAAAQKGWLPAKTLGLDASAPTRGLPRLRYVAYRTATLDLAAIAARFFPSHWDNYSAPPSGNFFAYQTPPSPLGPLDFCQGLTLAAAAGPSASNAFVLDASGARINIAYALADGGADRDGDGNVFDGPLNFDPNTPGLEAPARAASTSYDDLVLARGFADLSKTFSCPQSTRSMDAMAQSLEVVDETDKLREANKQSSIIMTAVDVVKSLLSIAGIATGVSGVTAASEALATAVAEDVVNTIDCVDPFTAAVGCPMLAVSATATGLAGAAEVAAVAAVALQVAALALNVTASVETGIIAGKAGAASSNSSASSLGDMTAQLLSAYTAAQAKAATDLAAAATDAAKAATSQATYASQMASLTNTSMPDIGKVNTALQDYKDSKLALKTYYDASGQASNMRSQATAAATSATAAASAAAAVAAIGSGNIVAATSAASTAATAADTAAKADLASDPTNSAKITASTNASVAAVTAQIDAFNASSDPAGYVAGKQKFAADQLASSSSLATQAATLEAAAAADKTSSDNSKSTYDAARSAIDASDGSSVGIAFDLAIKDYDDSIAKASTASQSQSTSDGSAQSVINSRAAYTSIASAQPFTPGTATAVTFTTGAAAILTSAALKGIVK